MSRRQITAALTDAVVQYYTKKRYCVNREIGLCKRGRLRADFLAMNMKNEIIIVEVKSCPSDFYTDHKWQKYLPYCNKFYFLMNNETYEKCAPDIPKGIGVISVHNNELWFRRNARRHDIDPQILLQLLIRMAFRSAEFNRYK